MRTPSSPHIRRIKWYERLLLKLSYQLDVYLENTTDHYFCDTPEAHFVSWNRRQRLAWRLMLRCERLTARLNQYHWAKHYRKAVS